MAQRVAIRIDVGPAAPLEYVAKLIQNVSTVCDVALALDRQSELNRAARLLPLDDDARYEVAEYLRTRRLRGAHDDPSDKLYGRYSRAQDILERLVFTSVAFGPPNLWPPAEAQAAYLLDALPVEDPVVPVVESVNYRNPLEIIVTGITLGSVLGSGGALWFLLNYVRDFGPKRENAKADAQKTRAEASKVEAEADETRAQAHQIRTNSECKALLTRALLNRVQEGDATLTPSQIDALIDDRAVGAIRELTQRPVEAEDRSDDEEAG